MDIFGALEMAIRAEVDAQRMYDRLAEETSDAEIQALFSYLAEYEMMHKQLLEAELKALMATHGEKEGRPSHWLKLLKEKFGAAGITDDSEFGQAKLELVATESIAKILKNANEKLSQKQAQYERELSIAADIQNKLLPQEPPQSPGLQIAASNVMARSVGGDFYDFVTNQEGQLALIVADSMGKGMSAALLMTTVRAVWRLFSTPDFRSPGQMMETVSRAVYPDLKATESFVTAFAAVYDQSTSLFRYSNAGHNPPIFRSKLATKCEELHIGNTPIGIFPETNFPSGELLMQEGDVIVIYTDGVVEARDRNDTLFGFKKLCVLIDQNHKLSAEGIKDAILSAVDSYTGGLPQADDITLVVLKKI